MIFRVIGGVMAALLAFAVAVQYNDPDPVRWMCIYGAATIVSVLVAMRRPLPVLLPIIVGVVALVWAADWSTGVPNWSTYTHMFDSWEMKNLAVEEARETSGLVIVVVWMAAVAIHAFKWTRSG